MVLLFYKLKGAGTAPFNSLKKVKSTSFQIQPLVLLWDSLNP